jgi:hypothetical protein
MYSSKKWLLGIWVGMLLIMAVATAAFGQTRRIRWDLISLDFSTVPVTVNPGGVAAALANDGSLILFTGSGFFLGAAEAVGQPEAVGEGTWATSGPIGAASGTYRVIEKVIWKQAPGMQGPTIDNIGPNPRPGFVVLKIAYSDGSIGTLGVSCHLVGTPDQVFEGVTATKGFVGFFNRVPPLPGVNANRTLFHLQ